LCDDDFLALDLGGEAVLLLIERFEEEQDPGLPIGPFAADCRLGLAQSEVIALLALLDHAFERGIRDVGIVCLEQHERGENSGEPSVPVLEWMDF
jgi:hypothetical protein